jgi:hypothetical protein
VKSYKCPVCGSNIQVGETTLISDTDYTQSVYRVRIDTVITHIDPIYERACADIFTALAQKQSDLSVQLLDGIV